MTNRSKLKRVLLWTLAISAIAFIGLAIRLNPSVAPVTGTYSVDNLTAAVTITFDDYERPFVRAETLNDALFAEGWLHVQHRLWQMEMFRRAGNGRLAELLGGSMLESDKELWRMGVPQLARQLEANASPKMKGHVAAYVHGINAAIESGDAAPPEFLLLQHTPDPWSASDVYALGALMAFQSAGNSSNELLRLALFNELGQQRAEIFLPRESAQEDFPYVLPRLNPEALETVLRSRVTTDPLDNPLMPRFALGSNGWVVAPSKSQTGNALFAFDSHDALGLPNLFYEVHLFYEDDRQIRGWSVAGLPGVINGYNERVAWGFTNIGDTQDLFLETRSPTDPLQFKDGDSWYTARSNTVEIPVSGRDQSESLTIVHTLNGPLISDDPPISLSWTVQHLDGMGIDNILEFNQAQSCEDFDRQLDRYAAPSLNATFADLDGNIGFRTLGLIPIRGAGEGLLPLDGSDPANRWQGFVPPDELPAAQNPEQGFLAAANARVAAPGEGPLVSADNAPGYRIRRIKEVLSSHDQVSLDQMRSLQTDWHDSQAALLMPVMIAAIEPSQLSPLDGEALAALQRWQGDWTAGPELAAPLIFQAWYRALATEVFRPAMSAEMFAHLFRNNYPLNHALDRLIQSEQESDWWRGEPEAIIARSFTAAVKEIQAVQGSDLTTWRLDRMHHVKLEHELGKAVPQLAWLFNAKPAPWGGGPATVGRARYRYDRAYDVTSAATMRVIGELKQPAMEMSAVVPGGQSGHPLSDHYNDQTLTWLARDLLPIASKPSDIVGGQAQVLTPKR